MRFIEKAGCTSRRRRLWSGPSDITRAVGPSTTSSSRKAGAHSKLAALDPSTCSLASSPNRYTKRNGPVPTSTTGPNCRRISTSVGPRSRTSPRRSRTWSSGPGRTGPASVMVR